MTAPDYIAIAGLILCAAMLFSAWRKPFERVSARLPRNQIVGRNVLSISYEVSNKLR